MRDINLVTGPGNWAMVGLFCGRITNAAGKKTEIQWKGAGATPYSRRADGKAVLRSSVREYLMSEAMYHLGIPTTRPSLPLRRRCSSDIMYNGNHNTKKEPCNQNRRKLPSLWAFWN
jgi:hypothetical protein